jgi:DNA-binding GntR family transcriptional regulator
MPDGSFLQGELAYQALREQVRSKRIVPGDVLSLGRLADELGMSRTPVREAVSKLVSEGLLIVLPKKGILVRSLTAQDVQELYVVREPLEALAAGIAATQMSDGALERLEETLETADRRVAEGIDPEEYRAMDLEFHASIWTGSGNKRVSEILGSLADAAVLDPWRDKIVSLPNQPQRSLSQHREIVEALKSRDSVASESAMRRHARAYWSTLISYLFGANPPASVVEGSETPSTVSES